MIYVICFVRMMESEPVLRPSAFEIMRNPDIAEHYLVDITYIFYYGLFVLMVMDDGVMVNFI